MSATTNTYRSQVQFASGLNLLAGIWLFVSTFAIGAHGPMMRNNIICGIAVAILAAFRAFGAYEEGWLSWLNVLVGAWVIVSPWAVMGTGAVGLAQVTIVNNVVTGGAAVLLGCWSAIASSVAPGRVTYSDRSRPPMAR